jgi:hypothetical protein
MPPTPLTVASRSGRVGQPARRSRLDPGTLGRVSSGYDCYTAGYRAYLRRDSMSYVMSDTVITRVPSPMARMFSRISSSYTGFITITVSG